MPFLLLIAAALVAWQLGSLGGPSRAPAGTSAPSRSETRSDAGSMADVVAASPREITPATPPGEAVIVELTEAPATRYNAPEFTEADQVYADIVAQLERGNVVYDASLGRAARELAYQHSVIGGLVPQDIVNFLLRGSGAVDRTVVQGYTATGGDDLSAVGKRLENLLGSRAGAEIQRVGIGEAYIPGAARPRYIAMLVSKRQIDVSPAPRTVQLNSTWQLTGTLPIGWEKPSALVLYPDDRMEAIEMQVVGRRFTLSVPSGDTSGFMDVSVSATGAFGPSPLMQLPVAIGVPLPTSYRGYTAADETDITTPEAAEELAFELLNADRQRFGIPLLVRDRELDAVARAHGLDMRDNQFFGHYSDETGTPGDRLAAAAYRVALHGENVASGRSIHGAEEGLMHSLGHRRNILQGRFSRVGIGVAGKGTGKATQWYLTQLFARPVLRVDGNSSARRLVELMTDARHDADAGQLTRVGKLDRVCESVVESVAAGTTDGMASRVLEQAKAAGLTKSGAYAWVGVTTDLDELKLPPQATDPDYSHVGTAVAQLPDHPNGLIGVVILFTGG
ncbi:MAG: hypothetical protein ACI9WU_002084 [Myxococcota bacterium]|jgi:uncharacterized protein YkwD